MDIGTAILLVTWIIPSGAKDQPNIVNSYQSTFASIEACEAARDKIVQDAQRINAESRTKWDSVYGQGGGAFFGSMHDVSVSAVCAGSDLKPKPGEPSPRAPVVPQSEHVPDACPEYPAVCWTRPVFRSDWKAFRVPKEMTAEQELDAISQLEAKLARKAQYKWARVAAEFGVAEAQADIGSQLMAEDLLPDGVTRDPKEGLKWLNISAQHGCLDAFFYLSVENFFILKSNIEALKWIIIAASRKNIKECNMFYEDYKGTSYYAKNKPGYDPLKGLYDHIAEKMTGGQVAEAQKLAREWKPTDPLDRRAWDNNEVRNGTREKP